MFIRKCRLLDSLRVYDVANSTCKSSLSAAETRPDFYLENDAVPATLSIELGKDGIAQCVLEDVKANCAVRNIYVNIVNQDDQITLFVYHNVLDALADCICKYDVSFKMSKLSAGNYKIKVYFARPNMKYEESDIAFNGLLNLTLNKKERVVLKSELSLPEI